MRLCDGRVGLSVNVRPHQSILLLGEAQPPNVERRVTGGRSSTLTHDQNFDFSFLSFLLGRAVGADIMMMSCELAVERHPLLQNFLHYSISTSRVELTRCYSTC